MAKKRHNGPTDPHPKLGPASTPTPSGRTLNSYRLGALPISINSSPAPTRRIPPRTTCPAKTPAPRSPPAPGLLLLLKNFLLSREPLYGVGEWAARFVPRWLGLSADEPRPPQR